jgi:hypothetical protein
MKLASHRLTRLTSVTLGMLLTVTLAACGGEEPEARYPEPPQPIGESRGPVTETPSQPEPAQQLAMQNAQASAGQQVQGGGDLSIGTDDSGYAETDPAALQDFREPLAPYGNWVEDASYGTVWVPRTEVVGADFAPYVSAGHWAYEDDYVWVSDYDWGWAPFHYGRWVWVAGRGWAWIPGRTYAGAWVVWRTGGYGYGYVGWAPAPPSWYWYGGYPVGVTYVHPVPYVFCGRGDLFHPAVAGHIVTGSQVAQIGAATRPYTPANPSVNGHSAANPSVNGHTAANPSVNGHSMGPNPQRDLGIHDAPHAPQGNASLAKAQAFSTPHTAVPMGAHAPSSLPVRQAAGNPGNPGNPGGNRAAPNAAQAPQQANLPPRLRPTASSPQYNGVTPTPYRQSTTIGRTDPGSSQARPSAGQGSYAAGSYGNTYGGSSGSASGRTYYPSQLVHSSPSYSAPSHPSTPSVHSTPSPSYSHSYSAPSHSVSTPSAPSHSYSTPSSSHTQSAPSRGGGRGRR